MIDFLLTAAMLWSIYLLWRVEIHLRRIAGNFTDHEAIERTTLEAERRWRIDRVKEWEEKQAI